MSNPLHGLAVSDTGFVFDPRTGHAYTVNATGLVVLKALKQGFSLSEVGAELERNFARCHATEDDIREFVGLLTDLGILSERQRGRA